MKINYSKHTLIINFTMINLIKISLQHHTTAKLNGAQGFRMKIVSNETI